MSTYRFTVEVDTNDSRPGTMPRVGGEVARCLHHAFGDRARVLDVEGLRIAYDSVVADGNAPEGHLPTIERGDIWPHACPKCGSVHFEWNIDQSRGEPMYDYACVDCGTPVARALS